MLLIFSGQYQDGRAQRSCKNCTNGQTTLTTGTDSLSKCIGKSIIHKHVIINYNVVIYVLISQIELLLLTRKGPSL